MAVLAAVSAGCGGREEQVQGGAQNSGNAQENVGMEGNGNVQDGQEDSAGNGEVPNSVSFVDDLGREVTVEHPQRVAALLGSFAQMWYLAGGEIVASADDAWEDFDLPLAEDAINLGMTKKLSLEKLFEADPDLVLASVNTKGNLEWQDTLESAKINVAYFDVSDFEDYLRVLKIFTEITGREDLYEQYGAAIAAEMEQITKESAERIQESGEVPKVLVIRASAAMIRAKGSEGNVLGEMLHDLGCVNIADSDHSLLENLSVEHIMAEDPDFIFVAQVSDDMEAVKQSMSSFIAENPAWSNLTAAKQGRIYYMEKELYTMKPNARWAEAYRRAAEILAGEDTM